MADSNIATVTVTVTAKPESALLLTTAPNQASYMRGQPVTLTVNVFNQLNPPLDSTSTLTVTGPDNYYYFDLQPISVSADAIRGVQFCLGCSRCCWNVHGGGWFGSCGVDRLRHCMAKGELNETILDEKL